VAWAKFAEAALASCAVGPRNRWAAEAILLARCIAGFRVK